MQTQIQRTEKIKKFISDKHQALLITENVNIFYYTDFYKSEGALLITEEETYLLVDFRYYEDALAKAKGCKVVEFRILINTIKELLTKHNITSLVIEADNFTLSSYSKYLKSLNEIGVSLESNGGLDRFIKNQRLIKSKIEIEYIQKAQSISEKAYEEVLNYIKPGVREKDIANMLEYLMKKYGADDISFDLITISGKKTSLPHGVPGEEIVNPGDFFTMDIGALYKGYHSDMTRTVAVKSYTEDMQKIYNIVLEAQTKALNSVCAGVKSNEIDKIARNIISNAGYSQCFGHSTGHGVGLDIHEAPNVSPNSDVILSEGMVITVEPGIYIENKFGVRIEDMVLVDNCGYTNFASLPKQLIVI